PARPPRTAPAMPAPAATTANEANPARARWISCRMTFLLVRDRVLVDQISPEMHPDDHSDRKQYGPRSEQAVEPESDRAPDCDPRDHRGERPPTVSDDPTLGSGDGKY